MVDTLPSNHGLASNSYVEMDDVAEVFERSGRNAAITTVFKKPVIVGKRPGMKILSNPSDNRQVDNQDKNPCEKDLLAETNTKNTDNETEIETSLDKTNLVVKADTNKSSFIQPKHLNLNYTVPSSSTICQLPYMLEVLKDGTIVQYEDIKSRTKSFLVFGRLPACDFVLQHPSISRYHAVLQYKIDNEGNEPGWFLFDLGSTHGTFLNKQQIPPKVYCRVRSGHVFRFGISSRLFILQGPEDDQEAVSDLSITELKELKLKRDLAIEKIDNQIPVNDNFVSSASGVPSTSTGINWGMGEDAEDENPLAENPFAIADDLQVDENLYLDDPKKTLRGWFERESYDLEYKVEEKNYAHFVCRVELPIDSANGAPIVAEASVRGGKKKEAVVQCALEACRILDRHGLLRQAKHESKVRRRKRQYDEDYYSSDEDTFLDRTGAAERKRQARMKRQTSDVIETYESLQLKYNAAANEISEIQKRLAQLNSRTCNPAKIETDDVDAYLEALQTHELTNRTSTAVLRQKLTLLQKEETKLKALLDIARPAVIGASDIPASNMKTDNQTKTACEIALHNQRETVERSKKSYQKLSGPVTGDAKADKVTPKSLDNVVDDLNIPKALEEVKKEKLTKEKLTQDKLTEDKLTEDKLTEDKLTEDKLTKDKLTKDKLTKDKLTKEGDRSVISCDTEKVGLVIRKRKRNTILQNTLERTETTTSSGNPGSHYEDSDDSKYAMWTPPEEQSGDGKNALNRKYGY